jgi:hypothetical protein
MEIWGGNSNNSPGEIKRKTEREKEIKKKKKIKL